MFFNVLTQVTILFILIFIGVILTRTKLLNETAVKGMTDMVLMLVTPCVIIKSFIREFEPKLLKALLISFLIAFLSHIGFIILSRILVKDKELAKQRVLQFGVIFSNCGFMSIPLQEALLGDMGVFYASSYIAIFNLFVWSYGITMISGDKKYMTPKKLILNPGIIGLVVGLAIFLLSLPVPEIVKQPINYLAALNTPLPMIIIGFHLASVNVLKEIKNLKLLFTIALRLIIFPLVALLLLYIFKVEKILFISSVISCCAPTAANTTMFSSKFGADTSLSVNLVSLSTLLSLITMPLLITLAEFIA